MTDKIEIGEYYSLKPISVWHPSIGNGITTDFAVRVLKKDRRYKNDDCYVCRLSAQGWKVFQKLIIIKPESTRRHKHAVIETHKYTITLGTFYLGKKIPKIKGALIF